MRCPVKLSLTAASCLFLMSSVARGQTSNSYPMLMSLSPVAAQIGHTTEHELSARYNLAGVSQVFFSGTGVTAEILPDEKEKPEDGTRTDVMASKRKFRLTVAADVVPGVRDFRVITPHGASTVGQVVLTRDPVISEAANNDTRELAQAITLPATVCGTLEKAEDVDFFKFTVAAGEAYTFHVQAQRLLNRLHDMQVRIDPLITLRTAAGVTLAANDNTYAGDPLLFYKFEQAGEYLLEVRDVRFQGNVDWVYCVEINRRPFVTQAFPLAVAAGTATQLALTGFNLPTPPNVTVTLPAEAGLGLRRISPLVGDQPANSFGVFVTTLPILVEPGAPSAAGGALPPKVTNITLPAVITGRIDEPFEADRYFFETKALEQWSFEVISRRAGSGMDPLLRVLNEQGGVLMESDDGVFQRVSNPDSWLENVPANGKYLLEISDLHQRGGPAFTYAIQATRAEPSFLLEADTDKTLLAPGINAVVYVRGLRKNGFVGDIQLGIEGLPPGVTAAAGKILANERDGCLILQAAGDAPVGVGTVRIFGTATHPVPNGTPLTLTATAQPLQEYYSPGGGRGNFPVDQHVVSVAAPMDIRTIRLSTTEIVLKPGGSQKIEVTIERAPGFKGNVTLDVLLQHLESPFGNSLPKGVKIDGSNSKTLLAGEISAGVITLKADADAPLVEKQLIPVNVHISINFVMKHTLCGAPVFVTVEK